MSENRSINVSYILTTRNRAKYLEKALKNIREFITVNDELIIMDGASSDETKEIVERNKDIVAHFQSEPDFGEAHGLNKGILISKGSFIKLLTDDDYTYPTAMKYAISVLELNPDLDAIICGGESFQHDTETNKYSLYYYLSLPPNCRLISEDASRIFSSVLCGLGLILRRCVISRVGLLDPTFKSVDSDYLARLIDCKVNLKYLNIKLYKHIYYAHSATKQNLNNESLRDRFRALLRIKGAWGEMMDPVLNYPKSVIAQVLGLDRLNGHEDLIELFFHAETLRQKRKLNLFNKMVRHTMKLFKNKNDLPKYQETLELENSQFVFDVTKEPIWDNSLRG
jgi:glycosyltransferase involved in cell wall biosynthesis